MGKPRLVRESVGNGLDFNSDTKFTGVIKNIDSSKSFGTIFCKKVKDVYNIDVYCPGEYLDNLKVWNTVVFELAYNEEESRLQAINIQLPAGKGQAGSGQQIQGAPEQAQVYTGMIKDLHVSDGFGLITCMEQDVVVASAEISGRGAGEMVVFEVGVNEMQLLQAFNVRGFTANDAAALTQVSALPVVQPQQAPPAPAPPLAAVTAKGGPKGGRPPA